VGFDGTAKAVPFLVAGADITWFVMSADFNKRCIAREVLHAPLGSEKQRITSY
jgi:hypothetical protein